MQLWTYIHIILQYAYSSVDICTYAGKQVICIYMHVYIYVYIHVYIYIYIYICMSVHI